MHPYRFLLLLLLLSAFLQKAPAQVPLGNLVSINIKPQDQFLNRRVRFGMSRAFHLFYDDISSGDNSACTNSAFSFPQRIRWNPSRNGNRFINYDELYGQMPQRTLAVLHGNAPFMAGGLFGKPLCADVYHNPADHSLPESYLINSIRASLFAARYGSAPAAGFPDDFDQIVGRYVESPDNHVGTGNGTVRFVEIFNEADNAWSDGLPTENTDLYYPGLATRSYCSPDQYAAMLSAAYDGHFRDAHFQIKDDNGNDLQPNAFWGIKNLSPGMQVVMAGTADLRKAWIDGVVAACTSTRPVGAPLPFDVVNYHFYSTTSHPAINAGTWNYFYNGKKYPNIYEGQFPEAGNVALKERLVKVLNEQNPLLQFLPTWITECGYTAAGANVGTFDAATVQGQWLTRYILEASAVRDIHGRGIERLFIYELNDDLNTAGFTYHGLQKSDGTPKKSWYHVMTMLSVLGDRSFTRNNAGPTAGAPPVEQYFLDSAPTTPLPVDDPRIYLYNRINGTGGTYALWVPRGTDMRYPGKLKLTGNWTAQPKLQKIEVLEYDEDGRRTMIPTTDIDFTPGSVNSQGQQVPATVLIKNLLLTETPMYLREVSTAYSDQVVPPVLNLTASCIGCQRTQLSWQNPTSANYSFFRVYYAKVSAYPGTPDHFDLTYLHLYGDQLAGRTNSLFVDLPVGEYYFWVIPFRSPYDASSLTQVTTSPNLQGTLTPASSYYVTFNSGNCSATPCLAPLTQASISDLKITKTNGAVVTQFGNSYYQNGFYEALIPSDPSALCAEMNAITAPPTPGIALAPNDNNTGMLVSFVVNFPTPQHLQAMQIHLYGGRAQIGIEFLEDCCNAYYLTRKYDFSGLTPQWVTLTNLDPGKRIEKVRITIQAADIDGVGVTIDRLLFCTSPATDRCTGGTSMSAMAPAPPADLRVTNIDSRSAVVSFWPATRSVQTGVTVSQEPIYLHTLRYGIALDAQGQIVQPQEVNIYGEQYSTTMEQALSSLVPNTTYIVDVLANVPCSDIYYNRASRIMFTTMPEDIKERDTPATPAADKIRLFPNPVGEVLHLDVPAGKYLSWRILSINGDLLRSGTIGALDASINIPVQDVPPGIQVVALFRADGKSWSQGFLKAE